jgi:hypothetical protein
MGMRVSWKWSEITYSSDIVFVAYSSENIKEIISKMNHCFGFMLISKEIIIPWSAVAFNWDTLRHRQALGHKM